MKWIVSTLSATAVLCSCASLNSNNDSSNAESLFTPKADWAAIQDPLVEMGELDNGVSWVTKILPDNGSRDRVELRLRVRTGSLNELDHERGVAHFVEHLAFNGTERFPKQSLTDFFQAAGMEFGGDINAYTDFSETVYQLTLPADNPELIDTGFEVLYDWATAITFDADEVTKEAPVVIEEWRSSFGTEAPAWWNEFSNTYADTRWQQRLPIGDVTTIEQATADTLRDYYQRWYRPNNVQIIVVAPEGVFDAQAKVSATFAAWQADAAPEPEYDNLDVSFDQVELLANTDSYVTGNQWQLYWPLPFIDANTAMGREASFYYDLITGALTGRLQRLGEEANAVLVDATISSDNLYDGSAVLMAAVTTYEGESNAALTQILTEVRRMQQYGLTQQEFDTGIRRISAEADNVAAWLEGADAAAHTNFLLYFLGEDLLPEDVHSYREEVSKMSETLALKDVNAFAQRVINVETSKGYYYHPKDAEVPQADWSAVYSAALELAVTPPLVRESNNNGSAHHYAGEIASKYDLLAEEDLYIWILGNGVPVVLKPSQLEPGRVNISAVLLGGDRQLDDELFPAAGLWREARIRSGIDGLSGQDFFESLDTDSIGYNIGLNSLDTTVSVNGQTDKLSRMFELLAGSLMETGFADNMVELTKTTSAEQEAQYRNTPGFTLISAYLPAVYGDDVRFQLFEPEQYSTVTEEQLAAVSAQLLERNLGLTIIMVGDVTPEQVTPLLRAQLAGLPLPAPGGVQSLGPITAENAHIDLAGQQEEETAIRYVFAATDTPMTRENLAVSEVMISALEKRLTDSIREDQSLTYGTQVFQRPQYFNEQQWLLHVRMKTNPDRQQEALTALDSEFQRLLDQPFSQQEISEAIERVRESTEQSIATNAGQLQSLSSLLIQDTSLDQFDNIDGYLAPVNTDAVNQLMQHLLQGKKVVTVFHP